MFWASKFEEQPNLASLRRISLYHNVSSKEDGHEVLSVASASSGVGDGVLVALASVSGAERRIKISRLDAGGRISDVVTHLDDGEDGVPDLAVTAEGDIVIW